jgi:hypothetical protein
VREVITKTQGSNATGEGGSLLDIFERRADLRRIKNVS